MEPQSKQQVFIVVRRDRHCDIGLSVHITREGADNAVTEFQAIYEDCDYTWVENNFGAPKWVRCVSSEGADGPSAYIEVGEVLE